MSRAPVTALAAAVAVCAALVVGCGGEEEHLDVAEGEPLVIDDLAYQIQITRFLNPYDAEDEAYLEGVEVPADPGTVYFGVFLTVENEGETAATLPEEITVVDTAGEEFEAIPNESPFALELGETLAPGAALPAPGTPAATGPVGGAVLLYELEEQTLENRPLELEIPGPHDEVGRVELDI